MAAVKKKSPVDSATLVSILLGARVHDVKTRLSIPQQGNLNPELERYLRATVTIDFKGTQKGLSTSFSRKTLERHILKAIHPSLTRAMLKSKAAQNAMDFVTNLIEIEEKRAIALFDKSTLKTRAERLMLTRGKRIKLSELREARAKIRNVLIGQGQDLTLDEVVEIWKNCHVEVVMAS
jgi:penicillin-binding protein-related factor A (putative recombinase)